jgi:hypothetical protein
MKGVMLSGTVRSDKMRVEAPSILRIDRAHRVETERIQL